jgi:hypothetical protein
VKDWKDMDSDSDVSKAAYYLFLKYYFGGFFFFSFPRSMHLMRPGPFPLDLRGIFFVAELFAGWKAALDSKCLTTRRELSFI